MRFLRFVIRFGRSIFSNPSASPRKYSLQVASVYARVFVHGHTLAPGTPQAPIGSPHDHPIPAHACACTARCTSNSFPPSCNTAPGRSATGGHRGMGVPSTVSTVSSGRYFALRLGACAVVRSERGDGRFFRGDADPSSNLRGEDGPRLLRRDEKQEKLHHRRALHGGEVTRPLFRGVGDVVSAMRAGVVQRSGARRGTGRYRVGIRVGDARPARNSSRIRFRRRTMLTRRVVRVSQIVVARARAVEAHLSSAVGASGASLALHTKSWPFSCSKTASSILNLPWCASHRPDTSMGLSGHRRGSRLDCMRRYPTRCSPLRAPRTRRRRETTSSRRTRVTTNAACDAALGDAERCARAPGGESQSEHPTRRFLSRFFANRRDDEKTRDANARRDVGRAKRRDATSSFARVRRAFASARDSDHQNTRPASTTNNSRRRRFSTTTRKFHRKLRRRASSHAAAENNRRADTLDQE